MFSLAAGIPPCVFIHMQMIMIALAKYPEARDVVFPQKSR